VGRDEVVSSYLELVAGLELPGAAQGWSQGWLQRRGCPEAHRVSCRFGVVSEDWNPHEHCSIHVSVYICAIIQLPTNKRRHLGSSASLALRYLMPYCKPCLDILANSLDGRPPRTNPVKKAHTGLFGKNYPKCGFCEHGDLVDRLITSYINSADKRSFKPDFPRQEPPLHYLVRAPLEDARQEALNALLARGDVELVRKRWHGTDNFTEVGDVPPPVSWCEECHAFHSDKERFEVCKKRQKCPAGVCLGFQPAGHKHCVGCNTCHAEVCDECEQCATHCRKTACPTKACHGATPATTPCYQDSLFVFCEVCEAHVPLLVYREGRKVCSVPPPRDDEDRPAGSGSRSRYPSSPQPLCGHAGGEPLPCVECHVDHNPYFTCEFQRCGIEYVPVHSTLDSHVRFRYCRKHPPHQDEVKAQEANQARLWKDYPGAVTGEGLCGRSRQDSESLPPALP
jgi:hypothetical protein